MNIKKVLVFFIVIYFLIGSVFSFILKPEQLWICPPSPDDSLKRPTIGNYPSSDKCTKQLIPWGDKVYGEVFMTTMWFPLVAGRTINRFSGGID